MGGQHTDDLDPLPVLQINHKVATDSDITLKAICSRLEAMRERTLLWADKLGLLSEAK